MAEGKKISFGFAKSIKKTVLKNTVPQEEKKVDYIECLDEKAIKVIGGEEQKDEPLVIPLLGSKTWHDRIVNKIDADIFETKTTKSEVEHTSIKEEADSGLSNGKPSSDNNVPLVTVKIEPKDDGHTGCVKSLEEQAAHEIIQDLNSTEEQDKKPNVLSLPLTENEALIGQEQSTLEDYEKIPVDAFGFAMLRGMGWQPGKGIGKNEKIVTAVVPELRPRGMGLGADKATLQKKNTDSKKPEEELEIKKGTFVKIIAGKQSDNYGQIEGFDEDVGRLIVKLALGGNTISLNEFMVQPVTKLDYSKNAKVLNAKKYEEYKGKQAKRDKDKKTRRKKASSSEYSESSEYDDEINVEEKKERSNANDKERLDKTGEGKSKSRTRYSDSECDSNSNDEKRSKRRSRSTSADNYKSKKSRKSKKHKKQDDLPERSSRKHKKKDKERDRTRDKKSKDCERTEKKKHKKRNRSRSRDRR